MTTNDNSFFDASTYWQQRVGADADISVVGHRAMGKAYNGEIYARRIEAFESMLERHVNKPPALLRVLDIGCGSGFYAGFWKARGVREYVGLDISSRTIERLAESYPGYKFVNADITETLPDTLDCCEPFNVITIFDVLYHVIEDRGMRAAIANVRRLLAEDSKLFVMDLLCQRNYQVSAHVIYRAKDTYLDEFRKERLVLTDSELLFHFLVPPISGIRFIDLFLSGTFKLLGYTLRLNDRLATWTASRLRRLDTRMRQRGVTLRNGELLVFARDIADRD